MADYAFYLRLPHLSSKRQYLLKDGKIVVTSEKKSVIMLLSSNMIGTCIIYKRI